MTHCQRALPHPSSPLTLFLSLLLHCFSNSIPCAMCFYELIKGHLVEGGKVGRGDKQARKGEKEEREEEE